MSSKNLENSNRNSFVALCDYASMGGWCWAIGCTTCGHQSFDLGFLKIARGEHPDDDSFWPGGRNEPWELAKRPEGIVRRTPPLSPEDQIKLAKIVALAKLSDIEGVSESTDWLGYIGLVINECSGDPARKIISDALIPQFMVLVTKDLEVYRYLQGKQARGKSLVVKDLGRIQKGLALDNALKS